MGTDDNNKRILGPSTPVQLGVFLILVAAIFSGGWMLASMNAKIDMLLTAMRDSGSKMDSQSKLLAEHIQEDMREWNAIKTRVGLMENVGSQPMKSLQDEVRELKRRLDVHETLGARP